MNARPTGIFLVCLGKKKQKQKKILYGSPAGFPPEPTCLCHPWHAAAMAQSQRYGERVALPRTYRVPDWSERASQRHPQEPRLVILLCAIPCLGCRWPTMATTQSCLGQEARMARRSYMPLVHVRGRDTGAPTPLQGHCRAQQRPAAATTEHSQYDDVYLRAIHAPMAHSWQWRIPHFRSWPPTRGAAAMDHHP